MGPTSPSKDRAAIFSIGGLFGRSVLLLAHRICDTCELWYESADTYAWIEHAPATMFEENPGIRKVKEIGAGTYIVILPGYQEFTAVSEWLAERDA